MNMKKVIVCDLDGTLAESKAPLSKEMADILAQVLKRHYLAIISGGSYEQFQKQFLSHLSCASGELKNLYIFPTMGAACYVYDEMIGSWKLVYEETLTGEEREKIKISLEEMARESGMDFSKIYGKQIDDRQTQVTFSGVGQDAPLEAKENWDKDRSKRKALIEILKNKIPQFEVRMGGATSIDVTRKGIDKAFAVEKLQELLEVKDEDVIFLGDAMYQGGNDAPVKRTGVDYIQAQGPDEAAAILSQYL